MKNTSSKRSPLLLLSALWILLVSCASADPVFTGKESKIEVKPTNENYYLAALVQESQFYDPTFYDDYLLTLDGKKILHFTKVQGEFAHEILSNLVGSPMWDAMPDIAKSRVYSRVMKMARLRGSLEALPPEARMDEAIRISQEIQGQLNPVTGE